MATVLLHFSVPTGSPNLNNALSRCAALTSDVTCPSSLVKVSQFPALVIAGNADYVSGGPYWADAKYDGSNWLDSDGNVVIFPGSPYSVDASVSIAFCKFIGGITLRWPIWICVPGERFTYLVRRRSSQGTQTWYVCALSLELTA